MLIIKNNKTRWLALISLLGLLGFSATAQTPAELILTWQAASFVPAGYQGRALAVAGTPITVALQVIKDGRLVDMSSQKIRWYLDGVLADAGQGRAKITFPAPGLGKQSVVVRASVLEEENLIDQFLAIPISQPVVVIDQRALPILKYLPYFFNVSQESELLANWRESDSRFHLQVENILNPLEFAEATLLR